MSVSRTYPNSRPSSRAGDPYSNDDDYLKSIEQYKDKSYYDRLLENPWLFSKQAPFSPTLMQDIGEFLGDTSARDNYYAGILQNQNQWLSDTIKSYEKQEYDSAQEQVQRQAAAGINPDLAMTATPGEGASPSPESLPNSEMNPQSAVADMFNLGQSVLTFSLGFYTNLQQVRGLTLENNIKSLQSNDVLTETAWRIIKEGIGESIPGLNYTPNTPVEVFLKDGKVWDSLTDSISRRIDKLPFSRRERRKLKSVMDSLIWNENTSGRPEDAYPDGNDIYTRQFSTAFETLANSMLKDLLNSRADVTESAGRIGSENQSQTVMKFIGQQIYRPLNELALDVQNALLTKNKSYLNAFNNSKGGAAQAKAEITGYRMQADTLNIKRRVMNAFDAINKKITGSRFLPDVWKLALQAGVAAAESKFLVNITQPFKTPSFGYGEKSGFSFGM